MAMDALACGLMAARSIGRPVSWRPFGGWGFVDQRDQTIGISCFDVSTSKRQGGLWRGFRAMTLESMHDARMTCSPPVRTRLFKHSGLDKEDDP